MATLNVEATSPATAPAPSTSVGAAEPLPDDESTNADPAPTGSAAPTATPTVDTATPTPTPTPTVEQARSPIAWSQGLTQHCRRNAENEIETYGFTHSYIVRDNVTGGRDLVEYDGASATLAVQGDQGTSGQSTATMTGAAMSFNTTLSAPAQRGESFTFTVTIDAQQVPSSSSRYTINGNMCVFG